MKEALRELAKHPIISAMGISMVLSGVADVVRAARGIPANPSFQITTGKQTKK